MSVRLLIALMLLLVALVALFVALVLTETVLSVWQRLAGAPLWLQLTYAAALTAFVLAALLLSWRWLRPQRREDPPPAPTLTESDLQAGLVASASAGADVEDLELALPRRSAREQVVLRRGRRFLRAAVGVTAARTAGGRPEVGRHSTVPAKCWHSRARVQHVRRSVGRLLERGSSRAW